MRERRGEEREGRGREGEGWRDGSRTPKIPGRSPPLTVMGKIILKKI
jgi:hypothetical protein